jgi:hypothetical protein
MSTRRAILVALVTLALAVSNTPAATPGQIDTFQNGITENWREGSPSPNPPSVISTGGPAGAGDAYLENRSSGSGQAGSRMVMWNAGQWRGSYLHGSTLDIQMDLANFGATDLYIRIAMQSGLGTIYASTNAFFLPPDGMWRSNTFGLNTTDLSLVSGSEPLNAVLGNVLFLRILSARNSPAWNGDVVDATLGVDNIFFNAVPVQLQTFTVE